MVKLYAEITHNQIVDAIYIWRLMKREDFYIFTCALPPNPYTQSAPIPTSIPSLSADNINFDTLVS
jgi:hypothetical protein